MAMVTFAFMMSWRHAQTKVTSARLSNSAITTQRPVDNLVKSKIHNILGEISCSEYCHRGYKIDGDRCVGEQCRSFYDEQVHYLKISTSAPQARTTATRAPHAPILKVRTRARATTVTQAMDGIVKVT